VLTQAGGAVNAQAGVMVRELPGFRSRSLYMGTVANAGVEFIYRNSTVTNANTSWSVTNDPTGRVAGFNVITPASATNPANTASFTYDANGNRKTSTRGIGAQSTNRTYALPSFDTRDRSLSQNARHERWLQLMAENRGKIDLAAAQRFMGDHFDSYEKATAYNERTLCGHIETSPRGMGTWQRPYAPAGAVQNKAADAALAEKMSMTAALGHACGRDFKAGEHLAKHPEFAWQRENLRDMNARGWTKFTGR